MTNISNKDQIEIQEQLEIRLSKEVEVAFMFIAEEKPDKTLPLNKLQKIAEDKGYYLTLDSLKIALSN